MWFPRVLVAIVACLSSAGPLAAQGDPACSPDARARGHLEAWVRAVAMARDTVSDHGKVRIWLQIPLVTNSAAVKVILESIMCERLRGAFAKSLGGDAPPASGLSVIAVQVDTAYVVLDPSQWCVEWLRAGVYGASLRQLELFLY